MQTYTKTLCTIIILLSIQVKMYSADINKTYINVKDFGVDSKSSFNVTEDESQKYKRWTNIQKAFFYCIENNCDLFFPSGIYDVGPRNFPFRAELDAKELLDCSDITIFGTGENTIFMTSSINGADVLQLNKIKNIKIKNVSITARQYGFDNSGSNGISITFGWDNIILDSIKCYDLPGVDKGTWVDGGKALTIQFDEDEKLPKRKVIAHNIISLNNAYGFRFDGRYVNEITRWKPHIDISIYVERAFQGVSIAFGNASKNIESNDFLNMNINAELIDCQQSIVMARVIGGFYKFNLGKTLSYEEIFLDKNKKRWVSSNADGVLTFLGQANKFVNVNISGNTGTVDRMLWFGAIGNIMETFNFKNQTENSTFTVLLKGKAKKENITLIENKEGGSFFNCSIFINKELLSPQNPLFNFSKSKNVSTRTK